MKRYIPTIILLFLYLAGCKNDKQNTPPPSGKTYKVIFNASSPSQNGSSTEGKVINGLKSNAVGPVSSSAKMLYYDVYNSNGQRLHEIKQDSTLNYFGRIADDLPAGTYAFYFAAGQNSLVPSQNSFSTSTGSARWADWFFKKVTLTVTDSSINQDVILERMVGQLQLNIEDAFPANASKISITTVGEFARYDFVQNVYTYPEDRETFFGIPTANNKPIILIGNTLTPITIKITCYDNNSKVLTQKVVSNVQFAKNVKTILSGKLFSTSQGDFAIGVNSDFDPTPFVTVKF
jgi:hypothetical protein